MTKQAVRTAAVVFFSLLIAFGCWLLTNALMDQQHFSLMNTVHSIDIKEPPAAGPGAEPGRARLSVQEIANILAVLHSNQTGRYHDPFAGQLSMEEAIKAAKSGLSYLGENGILPAEIWENDFTQTNAFLYDVQVAQASPAEVEPNPAYSFWSVNLGQREVSAQLTLNAQTGQIWMADISLSSVTANFDDTKALDALNAYEAYLGFSGGGGLRSDAEYAVKSYDNDRIGIIAQKKAGQSGHYTFLHFSMTLTR